MIDLYVICDRISKMPIINKKGQFLVYTSVNDAEVGLRQKLGCEIIKYIRNEESIPLVHRTALKLFGDLSINNDTLHIMFDENNMLVLNNKNKPIVKNNLISVIRIMKLNPSYISLEYKKDNNK